MLLDAWISKKDVSSILPDSRVLEPVSSDALSDSLCDSALTCSLLFFPLPLDTDEVGVMMPNVLRHKQHEGDNNRGSPLGGGASILAQAAKGLHGAGLAKALLVFDLFPTAGQLPTSSADPKSSTRIGSSGHFSRSASL